MVVLIWLQIIGLNRRIASFAFLVCCALSDALIIPVSYRCLWLTAGQFEFTKPLEDVKVIERENAIFECCVSHKKIPVTWYVAGVEVVPGPKYQVLMEEFTHRLAINVAKPADEGEVKAVFRDQTSTAKLFVERK